jgi:K+-sensing histidine kinase KdpD
MSFSRLHTMNVSNALTVLFCALAFSCYSQELASPISSPEHQKILREYKSKADEFVAKNLNRFALYQLQNYDREIDSMVAREKEDTLAAIQKNYTRRNIQRKTLTDSLKIRSAELAQSKDIYLKKYHGLLRKAAIAFVIWLVVVLIMLKWRNRSVRKSQSELDANIVQLKISEQSFSDGEELLKSTNDWGQKNAALFHLSTDMQKTMAALKEKLSTETLQSESFKILWKNSESILQNSARLRNFSNNIASQFEEPAPEKQLANINVLCEQYADLAYTQMLNEDGTFSCQFTKDFEKNLPTINVVPDAIGSLLLFVLSNAFNSVREKQKREIVSAGKGYVAKVSISTRILPRFVQIRIKDNGDGISDAVMNHIYEPFYSAKPAGEGAGLGLYFSEQIIKENNGEIKTESEHGNGTDVYLKFFLKS